MALTWPLAAQRIGLATPSNKTRAPASTVGRTPDESGLEVTTSCGPNPDPEIVRISPAATGPGKRLAALTIPPVEMASPGGVRVMVADEDFVGSATLVALIVTVTMEVMTDGAV
jgi:hypothetical protein